MIGQSDQTQDDCEMWFTRGLCFLRKKDHNIDVHRYAGPTSPSLPEVNEDAGGGTLQ